MHLVVPKEILPGENRVPIIPDTVKKLCRLGATISIESGLGIKSGFTDKEYEEAGAAVSSERAQLIQSADMLLRLRKPSLGEVTLMKEGCVHVSYLDPFNDKELVSALKSRGVTAISMEMIPRTTRSQKMDALKAILP